MSNLHDESERSTPSAQVTGRLDLVIEQVVTKGGQLAVRAIPDLRRYDRSEHNGEACYIDRFTGDIIPLGLFETASADVPMYDLRPRIGSAAEYGDERAEAVTDELAGHQMRLPSVQPAPHREPAETIQELSTPFLSLDICDSTLLRRRDAIAFDRASEILLLELQIMVGQFEATILKSTGDGFIAYLPHPSFTRQCDMVVDLGTSMIHLSRNAVGAALHAAGLPRLSVRIGADYGVATFQQKANPITGFKWSHVDSDALNLAVKMERGAYPDTMRIGEGLYRLLHVQWLERARRVEAESLSEALRSYPVYELT